MTTALFRSSNTYFLALEDGSAASRSRCAWPRHGADFDQPTPDSADQIIAENRGSFTLGAEATSPLDLASAYSTLARQRHPVRPRRR